MNGLRSSPIVMLLALVWALVPGLEAESAGATSSAPSESVIQNLVKKITSKASPGSAPSIDDILITVCGTDLQDISDKDIDSLILLVDDSNFLIVTDGAVALAVAGPKATRAVPALEEAFKRAKAYESTLLTSSLQASGFIQETLNILKGHEKSDCRHITNK